MNFADVLVEIPLNGVFTYSAEGHPQLCAGMRVKVPFGKKEVFGAVVRMHNNEPEDFKAKPVSRVLDTEPVFDERLVRLAEYTADAYVSFVGEALACALPWGEKASSRFKPRMGRDHARETVLTPAQNAITQNILAARAGAKYLHLLYGITGSGKTEVYIELAKKIISEGASVLYLVPEISLSSQLYDRLSEVFGGDLVLFHSGIAPSQKLFHWQRFYSGDAKIALGTRSAVFMQCPSLGLLIVDEEHDASYKEHASPRYSARSLALFRAQSEHAIAVLGSATPSLESMYAAESGALMLHRLEDRFGGTIPKIEIVKIEAKKERDMLSPVLMVKTKHAVDAGHQAIYLLNRRGFAPIVMCDACGARIECPHCSIALNFHRDGKLLCHYCGYEQPMPETCPSCKKDELAKIGSGTQRIETLIEKTFSGLRIFRMDQDSARKKGAAADMSRDMHANEIDILLGTQMIAKGFDFKNVAVVGVLMADIGINVPDFRAGERIFSLLLQVAGRAGRGDAGGTVIVQTLNPAHPLFEFLTAHDYDSFYRYELSMRKLLFYPPFSRMVRFVLRGSDEQKVSAAAAKTYDLLCAARAEKSLFEILGPAPAPLAKIGGNYRHHIILKSAQIKVLRAAAVSVRIAFKSNDVYLEIDVDPADMM